MNTITLDVNSFTYHVVILTVVVILYALTQVCIVYLIKRYMDKKYISVIHKLNYYLKLLDETNRKLRIKAKPKFDKPTKIG